MAIYNNLYNIKNLGNDNFNDIRNIHVDLREDKLNEEDCVYSTIEVSSMICWKYHETQQKPKERGSAEFSLKELANDVIDSSQDEIRYGTVKLKENSQDEYEIIEMTELIKNKIKDKLGEDVIKEKLEKNK